MTLPFSGDRSSPSTFFNPRADCVPFGDTAVCLCTANTGPEAGQAVSDLEVALVC